MDIIELHGVWKLMHSFSVHGSPLECHTGSVVSQRPRGTMVVMHRQD